MDFNLVVLAGQLAAAPERRTDKSTRLLLTVRSTHPEPRVDLVSTVIAEGSRAASFEAGDAIWLNGSLQRRFSPASGRSRLEVFAHHVEMQPGG